MVAAGRPLGDVWTDIPPINSQAKERVGYPTQKPLALLERIIKASSNEGDVVLDPFCGCATACVAADRLGRKWVGIDISPKAVELVNMRLQRAMGSLFHHGYVTARTDIPRRTDVDAPKDYRQNKHVLFGRQEGLCAGCKVMFPFRNFTIDHVVPQSRGGTDHLDNLQLLCGACNSLKGNRDQAYLIARLKEIGGLIPARLQIVRVRLGLDALELTYEEGMTYFYVEELVRRESRGTLRQLEEKAQNLRARRRSFPAIRWI